MGANCKALARSMVDRVPDNALRRWCQGLRGRTITSTSCTITSYEAPTRRVGANQVTVCGVNLKAVGGGMLQYAFDNNRRYFHRAAVHETGMGGYELRMPPFRSTWDRRRTSTAATPSDDPAVPVDGLAQPPVGRRHLPR
jgi:hypothetical protein